MSLPVFYLETLPGVGDTAVLDGSEGRHAATVKRLGVGEQLRLIDGRGNWAEATVTAAAKNSLTLRVGELGAEPERLPRVVVVQALPKAERSELAVDLATQAGADEIIAWQADRCVARWTGPKVAKGVAKWQAAALAAAKQSRRALVPQVHEPLSTRELVALLESENARALVLHEDATLPLKEVDFTGVEKLFLLIGPEGGIGAEELNQLQQAGAQAVRLGPEVLRTASAAMVALSAIGALTSRW